MVSGRLRPMAMRGAPLTGRHGHRLRTAADTACRICGYMRLPCSGGLRAARASHGHRAAPEVTQPADTASPTA